MRRRRRRRVRAKIVSNRFVGRGSPPSNGVLVDVVVSRRHVKVVSSLSYMRERERERDALNEKKNGRKWREHFF